MTAITSIHNGKTHHTQSIQRSIASARWSKVPWSSRSSRFSRFSTARAGWGFAQLTEPYWKPSQGWALVTGVKVTLLLLQGKYEVATLPPESTTTSDIIAYHLFLFPTHPFIYIHCYSEWFCSHLPISYGILSLVLQYSKIWNESTSTPSLDRRPSNKISLLYTSRRQLSQHKLRSFIKVQV